MPLSSSLTIDDITVSIVSKRIRRVNLRIIPPDGSVIVSKPHLYPEEKVIAFVRSKLDWIRTHQERIRKSPWAPPKEYVTGEKHSYLGNDYDLEVVEKKGKSGVSILDAGYLIAQEKTNHKIQDTGPFDSPSTVSVRTTGVAQGESWIAKGKNTKVLHQGRVPDSSSRLSSTNQGELFEIAGSGLRMTDRSGKEQGELPRLVLTVPPGSGKRKRKAVLEGWYREQLQRVVPEFICKYEPVMGVSAAKVRYRSMKSRWGSCAVIKRNITLNTELAKKSLGAIESVVVHELTHLKERGHNARFYQLMSEYFPEWRSYEKELKSVDSGQMTDDR